MDNLYEYFSKFSEKVNFLTVKNINLNSVKYENVDFPIYSNVLIDNVKKNQFSESICTSFFIEGILILNGIDSNFKNLNLLNKFLLNWNNDILEFVKSKLNFTNFDFDTLIYNQLLIRGAFNLGVKDDFLKKFYIRNLIFILDYDSEEFYNIIMNEIKLELSYLLKSNDTDFMVNMLYGDLNVKEKFYIKADLFYKKALKYSNNIEINKLLNSKLNEIYVKVEIEKLLQLIEKFRYEEAYEILFEIREFDLDAEDSYWVAYCYNKLNEDENAIFYYEKALILSADYLNIYLDLGLLYYKIGDIKNSLNIFEKGLKIYTDDEKLLFNKIIIELKLEKFDDAKKDIEKILMYEDLDNTILNDVLYLKNLYDEKLSK